MKRQEETAIEFYYPSSIMLFMVEWTGQRSRQEHGLRMWLGVARNDPDNPLLMTAKELTAQGSPVSLRSIKGKFEPDGNSQRMVMVDYVEINTWSEDTEEAFNIAFLHPDMKGLIHAFKGDLHTDPFNLAFFEQDTQLDKVTVERIKALSCIKSAEYHDNWTKFYEGTHIGSAQTHKKQVEEDREMLKGILQDGQEPISPEEIRVIIRRIVADARREMIAQKRNIKEQNKNLIY